MCFNDALNFKCDHTSEKNPRNTKKSVDFFVSFRLKIEIGRTFSFEIFDYEMAFHQRVHSPITFDSFVFASNSVRTAENQTDESNRVVL